MPYSRSPRCGAAAAAAAAAARRFGTDRPQLAQVDLLHNPIRKAGFQALMQAQLHSKTLTRIGLEGAAIVERLGASAPERPEFDRARPYGQYSLDLADAADRECAARLLACVAARSAAPCAGAGAAQPARPASGASGEGAAAVLLTVHMAQYRGRPVNLFADALTSQWPSDLPTVGNLKLHVLLRAGERADVEAMPEQRFDVLKRSVLAAGSDFDRTSILSWVAHRQYLKSEQLLWLVRQFGLKTQRVQACAACPRRSSTLRVTPRAFYSTRENPGVLESTSNAARAGVRPPVPVAHRPAELLPGARAAA